MNVTQVMQNVLATNNLLELAWNYHAAGNWLKAEETYIQILRIDKKNIEALHNLGILEIQRNQPRRAIELFNQVIKIERHYASAYCNRGVAKNLLGKYLDAIDDFNKTLKFDHNSKDAHLNRGIAYYKLKQAKFARECFNKAIFIDPNFAVAHYNCGKILSDEGENELAIGYYRKAISIQPNYPDAQVNLGLCLLKLGQFEEGWERYEWRWNIDKKDMRPREFKFRKWQGEPLNGKSIFVYAEQGLGDSIMFSRYMKMLKALGATTYLEVDNRLARIFEYLEGVDEQIALNSSPVNCDFSTTLASLPRFFTKNFEGIPSSFAYLSADSEDIITWSKKLGSKSKPRIGIVWSGNPNFEEDFKRSVPLELLLKYIPSDFAVVSLKKDLSASDHRILKARNVQSFADEIIDLEDTAAICSSLDLVISTCTSVAHLCGAIGKSCYVLLPQSADWRWFTERSDTPWYPSIRLFRQIKMGDWTDPLNEIGKLLIAGLLDVHFKSVR